MHSCFDGTHKIREVGVCEGQVSSDAGPSSSKKKFVKDSEGRVPPLTQGSSFGSGFLLWLRVPLLARSERVECPE